MENLKIADFHQDTLNPKLAEVLQAPELRYAEGRAIQLPKQGLLKLDLVFSSVYRRISDQQKSIASAGSAELQAPIKQDLISISGNGRKSLAFRRRLQFDTPVASCKMVAYATLSHNFSFEV